MPYIIILLLTVIFFIGLHLYKNPKDRRKIITAIVIILLAVLLLRFGQVVLAVLAILVPIFLKYFLFFIRNLGLFNYFSRNFNKYNQKYGDASKANVKLSEDEAYDILGLKKGVSKEEIEARYKELMKRNHPDKGGSKHIAVLLNKAKEKLI